MSIDPQKARKLLTLETMFEEEPSLLLVKKFVEELDIKGEKGDKGDKGDTGEKGEKGDEGAPGKDGKDGSNGRDGRDGRDGEDGEDGNDGKDGSPDDPEEVVAKVNASSEKIQRDRIDGLDDEMRRIERVALQPRGGAPGYSLTIQDDGVTLDKNTRYLNFTGGTLTRSVDGIVNVPLGSSSGSGYQAATGTVDGSNDSFTFSNAPAVLSVDGVVMQKTASDGTVNWTGTTSITLTTPPTWDIFAIA